MQVEYKFKCPWCGEGFESVNELNCHAKEHYEKCIIDAAKCVIEAV